MKKFGARLLQISAIILLMSLVLNVIVYPALKIGPWTWGSDLLQWKREELLKHRDQYNTLIIGSSRVYRQVNPLLLDSLAGDKMKSYNVGVNWLFAPESFFVMDQLIKTDSLRFKCVIIELSKIRSIDYSNLHTARIKYWYDFSNYMFAVRAVASSNFSIPEKVATIFAHTISYIDRILNLGYLTEVFNFKAAIDDTAAKRLATGTNGFAPLHLASDSTSEENTAERNRLFLSDTTVVSQRLEISRNQFAKFEKQPELLNKYNRYYAEQLQLMIMNARKNGIHLVFLLPPRIDANQYKELIPLFFKIDPAHRIEISDGRKYPELYLAANSFDATHLNARGADLYTTLIASQLKSLLEKQK